MIWAILMMLSSLQASEPPRINPFAELRSAYRNRDAEAAARAYANNGTVIARYAGAPEERHEGQRAIAGSFTQFFSQIDAGQAIDLNFRATEMSATEATGFYRMRIGRGDIYYGRFDVTFAPDGRFLSDTSSDATAEDFEGATGPVMLAAEDETLDRSYYASMAGRYTLPDGCKLIVTRSIVRLFVRNSCTQEWRGLTRVSGREWTAGDRVLSSKVKTRYRFAESDGDVSITGTSGDTVTAKRNTPYKTENVSFRAADGTSLTGTLYLPANASGPRPASVMIHGSGPQDRDGYASIIAVMADEMAASGRAVLTFDKRGSGGSEGDGDRAGFTTLASDAVAGMRYLESRSEVDAKAIGLAGSSQAGWIAAQAVKDGAKPADVFLLGAAGAAMTVREQNLYNTEIQMRCAGLPEADIALALDQQRAFFDFLADPKQGVRLDSLTEKASAQPNMADWLFPNSQSIDRSGGAWYTVLDPAFDPLPVWRDYHGKALFLFGAEDDATPTPVALKRLRKTSVTAVELPGAQHLGLMAKGKCEAGLDQLSRFSPMLIEQLGRFARAR